jgi:hypothetical protein
MSPARIKPDIDMSPVVELLVALRHDIGSLRAQLEQTGSSLQAALANQADTFRKNVEAMIWDFLKIVASTLTKAVFSTVALGALAYVWNAVLVSWRH